MSAADAAPAGNDARDDIVIEILGGQPDAEELAAVTAVLTALLEESANARRLLIRSPRSGWQHSRRQLRTPVHAEPGAWRAF